MKSKNSVIFMVSGLAICLAVLLVFQRNHPAAHGTVETGSKNGRPLLVRRTVLPLGGKADAGSSHGNEPVMPLREKAMLSKQPFQSIRELLQNGDVGEAAMTLGSLDQELKRFVWSAFLHDKSISIDSLATMASDERLKVDRAWLFPELSTEAGSRKEWGYLETINQLSTGITRDSSLKNFALQFKEPDDVLRLLVWSKASPYPEDEKAAAVWVPPSFFENSSREDIGALTGNEELPDAVRSFAAKRLGQIDAAGASVSQIGETASNFKDPGCRTAYLLGTLGPLSKQSPERAVELMNRTEFGKETYAWVANSIVASIRSSDDDRIAIAGKVSNEGLRNAILGRVFSDMAYVDLMDASQKAVELGQKLGKIPPPVAAAIADQMASRGASADAKEWAEIANGQ